MPVSMKVAYKMKPKTELTRAILPMLSKGIARTKIASKPQWDTQPPKLIQWNWR